MEARKASSSNPMTRICDAIGIGFDRATFEGGHSTWTTSAEFETVDTGTIIDL
jgi:hypothetical protein